MVLASLEPNDPQLRRDDPRFGGDYKEFRKADKAWSKRESKRRKVLEERTLPAETTLVTSAEAGEVTAATGTAAAPLEGLRAWHPKPRGQAPLSGGVMCTWDYARGTWLNASGEMHVARSSAARAADAREKQAAELEMTAQERRAICADIDAEARRDVLAAGGMLVDVAFNDWVRGGRQGWFEGEVWQLDVAGPKLPYHFRPDVRGASALGYSRGKAQRPPAYFASVAELLAERGEVMSLDAFKSYLRDVAPAILAPLFQSCEQAGKLWERAMKAKPPYRCDPKLDGRARVVYCSGFINNGGLCCGQCQYCTQPESHPSQWCHRCAHAIEQDVWEQLFQVRQRNDRILLCSGCRDGTTDLAARYAALRAELDAAAAAKAAAAELEAERKRLAAAEWQRGEAERQRQREEQQRQQQAFRAMQAERDAVHSERVTALAHNLSAGSTAVAACIRVRFVFGDSRDINPEWSHCSHCLSQRDSDIRVPFYQPLVSLTLQTVTSGGVSDEDEMWRCPGRCGFERHMTAAESEARRAACLLEVWQDRRAEACVELRRSGSASSVQCLPWDASDDSRSEWIGGGDASSSSGSDGSSSGSDGDGELDQECETWGASGPGLASLTHTALKRLCDANQLMISGKRSVLYERLCLAREHGRPGECPRCGYSQLDVVCPADAPSEPCRVECRHWRGQNARCGWMREVTPANKRVVLWLPLVDSRERDLAGVGIDAPVTPHGPRRRVASAAERAQRAFFREFASDFGEVNFNALDDSAASVAGVMFC